MDPIEYHYDVVAGVSVGAINAALIALYEPGKEKDAVVELENLWRTHLPQDFWNDWPYVSFLGGFYYPAILDSTPMHEEIKAHLEGHAFKRKIAI